MKVALGQGSTDFDFNRRYNHCGGASGQFPRYLNRDVAEDLWDLDELGKCTAKANMAVLAVGRRKDDAQRKILATVPFNCLKRRPRELLPDKYFNLGMLGGTALARVSARVGQ